MIKYYEEVLDTINNSIMSIDENLYNRLLNKCIEVLNNGGKIIASGLGKNVPICEKFEGTMSSYGLEARFLHTNSAVHGDLGIVKDNDLVILLSKSGNTEETLKLAYYLSKRRCEKWAFTFDKDAKVCSLVDNSLVLSLENEGDLWDIVPNNSTTVYLIILQAIAVELSKRLNITREQFGHNHPGGAIGEILGEKRCD